ncbi:hypothetical protein ACLBXP_25940, partial [Methylobacterium sp. A54F]
GAALQTLAGSQIRTQITLGRLARECARLEDGSIMVKVGDEGRVLLGPAGSPGSSEVPVTVSIRYDEKPVTVRSRRVSVAVPAGSAQGFFSFVEEG